jgi:hypothetical protein
LSLVWDLIKEGLDRNTSQRETRHKSYSFLSSTSFIREVCTTSKSTMPLERLILEHRENRIACEYCKNLRQEIEGKAMDGENHSHIFCTLCNVALCISSKRNCFVEYHT